MAGVVLEPKAGDIYSLRPASASEAGIIRKLVRGARLNPMGLNWRRFVVAAEPAGRIIGCVQAKPHSETIVELASLVVLPEWRRRGVARELVEQLQGLHGPPLWLMCRATLAPFYERFGFGRVQRLDELPPYFRRTQRLFGLFRAIIPSDNHLAIMVWQPAEERDESLRRGNGDFP